MGLFTITPEEQASMDATDRLWNKLAAVKKARKAHKKAAKQKAKSEKK